MNQAPQVLQVLLVDDDTVDRMAVLRALQRFPTKVRVEECDNAKAALQWLGTSTFDCVISDFEMPGDNGLWLLEQMQARAFDVPLVILTGQGDEQTAVTLMKAGALDYVAKSSDLGERVGQVVERAVRTHRAEREARLARERLALTLEATGLGIWDYGLATGVVALDKRCQALLELDTPVLSLEESLTPVHAEDRAALCAQIDGAQRDPAHTQFHSIHRCRTVRTQRELWVEATGQVFWERGHPVRLMGTLADITARKQEELATQKRVEFEQQLIGIVSHDLRNPIAAMMLGAKLIADQAGSEPMIGRAAMRVVSSGERATRLIRDLLDFTQARLGRGLPITPGKTDVRHVLRQVVEELTLAHPERPIEQTFEGDGDCLCDGDRIAQALGNLLRNALSYSPRGSRIRVTTRIDGSEITVAVHNQNVHGPIPADIQPVLFEPFRRGDQKSEPDRSIGLGLYIVREVVRAHGGRVEVRSTAAEGTTFTMRLPRGALREPAQPENVLSELRSS